jgi:hypothetical protein
MEIARVGRTSKGGWGETTGAADMSFDGAGRRRVSSRGHVNVQGARDRESAGPITAGGAPGGVNSMLVRVIGTKITPKTRDESRPWRACARQNRE